MFSKRHILEGVCLWVFVKLWGWEVRVRMNNKDTVFQISLIKWGWKQGWRAVVKIRSKFASAF